MKDPTSGRVTRRQTASAVRQSPFSKSARRGAPPVISIHVKNKPGVYFPVKGAHPPDCQTREVCAILRVHKSLDSCAYEGLPQDEPTWATEVFEKGHLRQDQNNPGRCPPYVVLVNFLPRHLPPLKEAGHRLPKDLNRDELLLPVRCKPLYAQPIDSQQGVGSTVWPHECSAGQRHDMPLPYLIERGDGA